MVESPGKNRLKRSKNSVSDNVIIERLMKTAFITIICLRGTRDIPTYQHTKDVRPCIAYCVTEFENLIW